MDWFDLFGDYYSHCAGYVIEGIPFKSEEAALCHMKKTGWEHEDAVSYLSRLYGAYLSRRKNTVAMPVAV